MPPWKDRIIRFYYVDALRGLAALVIVVFHYHHFFLSDFSDRPAIPPTETFPYAGLLGWAYSPWAANAVQLFWLISGFVFAHVYLPRRADAWDFGVARFARLYPLHFATLLYVAGLQAVSLSQVGHWQIYGSNDVRHFILQMLMASNWTIYSHGLSFNGPIWSVSLEIVVYGLFFASLLAMKRAPILVSLALSAACWMWVEAGPTHLGPLRSGVFDCGFFFFLGSLLRSLKPHASAFRTLSLTTLGVGLAAASAAAGEERMAVAGIAIGLVSLAAGMDRVAPVAGRRLSFLGDMSYSIYLVHVPLQMTVLLIADLSFGGTRAFAHSFLTLPVYVIAAIIMALAAHKWLEKPVGQAIRTRLLSRPKIPPKAADQQE